MKSLRPFYAYIIISLLLAISNSVSLKTDRKDYHYHIFAIDYVNLYDPKSKELATPFLISWAIAIFIMGLSFLLLACCEKRDLEPTSDHLFSFGSDSFVHSEVEK